MVRFLFRDPAARTLFVDWDTVARDTVDALRLAYGHERRDPLIAALIDELGAEGGEFIVLWERQGRITLTCQTFEVRDAPGQSLVAGTAEPGSADAYRLALLRVAPPLDARLAFTVCE
ncbi:MmyB family transcriptional regulator [Streptomyces prunicolor]|uniref:MmyB family transcriptional regulator n=1 Tax=Streptomyces prunicolor TaxID=67348 RepID=UPI00035EA97D|nr:hypothetical protein [Streptomyces prunicolor]